MRRVLSALPVAAGLVAGVVVAAQTVAGDIVADVRSAMASGGIAQGEVALSAYRRVHSDTPEAIEALSWLARGALAAKHFDKANQYAGETRDLATIALKDSTRSADPRLQQAIGAALETLAFVLVDQGARSDAVHLLRSGLDTYRDTAIGDQIQANLNLLSLEGQPARRLDGGVRLGPGLPGEEELKGKVVLLFFWAHWCANCKAESPMIGRLYDKYRSQGLVIVAPTRRYGYITAGRPSSPDRELRHILGVRDAYYRFLRREPVPVADANFKEYGVASIPMHVLIDRRGFIRFYQPGNMTEQELEDAIRGVL